MAQCSVSYSALCLFDLSFVLFGMAPRKSTAASHILTYRIAFTHIGLSSIEAHVTVDFVWFYLLIIKCAPKTDFRPVKINLCEIDVYYSQLVCYTL